MKRSILGAAVGLGLLLGGAGWHVSAATPL
jgi:hypothetical protein